MARTNSAAERAAVAALHGGHFSRFEIQDADGLYRDYTQYLKTDWLTKASIEEHIDSNTIQLNANFKREVGTLSLSPFVAASLVNRNSVQAYATAIDAWRKWRLWFGVMREGYPPTGTDWKEMCQGRIDVIEWSGDDILVTGRGEEAVLLDFWIATERQYGSVGGTAMETVIQSMNDNNLLALSPTLSTPVSPSYLMLPWTQQKGNLFPATVAVSDKAGFKLRYRYDASDINKLTLFKPNRTAVPGNEVWTLGPSEYTNVTRVAIDKQGIRNFIKLRFVSPTLGIQTVIYPHMAGTGTVSCAAGVATFSSSQAGIIKGATDGSNTEIIVAGIPYTVTAFNGTTGATLLSQLASGGTPTFGASSFTLHDTLSGAGTTTSLSRFGRTDMELDLAFDTQVTDSTKAQGMCDAVGSDLEFPDLEQQIETLGAWFIQLHDYGKFLANPQLYDSDQYAGVTSIRHDLADATIKTTIGVRGKPAGAYRTWKMLGDQTAPSGAVAQQALRDTKPLSIRITRVSETSTQIVVRVAVISVTANASVSIAYDAGGLTVTPASPQVVTATTDYATTPTTDFTITRDVQGGTPRRVTFTASATGFVSVTDGVDVPPQPSAVVRFKGHASASISVPSAAYTILPIDVEHYDPAGIHAGTNGFFTVPTGAGSADGSWHITAWVQWDTNTTGNREIQLQRTGGLIIGADKRQAVSGTEQPCAAQEALTVADTIGIWAWQDSGVARNVTYVEFSGFFIRDAA